MNYYENINLEKGMYSVPGKSFTQVLEEMDSSDNYRGTPLDGLDAYQRQLKRFDIKVGGKASDTVEKFFTSTASAALFPEYVSRAVAQGMESNNIIPDVVATITQIDALDYRSITAKSDGETESESKSLKVVPEGETIPQTIIKTTENLIKLNKRGRILAASYESIRFQKLDLLTVTLRQIGAYIADSQIKDAVDVLLNGDSNSPAVVFDTTATGDLNYSDFVKLWGNLNPYKLNTIIAGTDAVQKIMMIDEFRDSQAGLDFHGTGNLCTPLGAKVIHVPSMESGKLIGLDKSCALEMVQAGEISTEYDKLIDRQLERAAISVISGFARIFADAAKGMSFTV